MKIALITGASSGLGRTFARQICKLYKNLDEIWIVARRIQRLEELKKELPIPVRIFAGDLYSKELYENLKRELSEKDPDIRMLVNAAGFGLTGDFSENDTELQLQMIDLNCRALTEMTSICYPYLKKGSRVIQVASAAAFSPQPGFAVYAASKAYVYSLSLALRNEWKEQGIVVTCLCPGPVATEFFEHTGSGMNDSREGILMDEQTVVRQALKDARDKKALSVPGLAMKGARIAAKLIPDQLTAEIMKISNEKEE